MNIGQCSVKQIQVKRRAIEKTWLQTGYILQIKKKELQAKACNSLILLVGRARFELATNGLKVRCSTG